MIVCAVHTADAALNPPDKTKLDTKKTSFPAPSKDEPVLINADMVSYDQVTSLVTASGNVEIYQGQRMLIADRIQYNKKTDTVTADGNISTKEPNGDMFFSDHLEFKDQMKQGVIQQLRARLADKSRLVANRGVRVNKDIMILEKAIYSPCKLCAAKPKRPPAWQIKADKVTINQQKQKVSYKNAFFETYGIPIIYTPYFSHPTPHADRKSGFLTPTYSNITTLGSTVKIPYYYNIAPNMDTTLTPYFTSAEGPVMVGEFRHLIKEGRYTLQGSITNPDDYRDTANSASPAGRRFRGHLQGDGLFRFANNWDSGFNFKRASDDTYLHRYKFGDEDFLTSRLYAENIKDRDYIQVQGIAFQELTSTTDPRKTPFVLPLMNSHHESTVAKNGSRWSLDTNAMLLSRKDGTDSRRLSSSVGWEIPYISATGQVLKASTSIRGDFYDITDGANPSNPNQDFNGGISRVIPEAKLDWKFPLLKEENTYNILLEPTANVIISPYGGNPAKIPNEDSQEVELSDTNLFSNNRFTGLDRVEDGPRSNYGLRSTIRNYSGQSADFLFGQSYRLKQDSNLHKGSGLDDNFSDYVGRVGIKPLDMLDLAYRFRLGRENFNPRRNEIDSTISYHPLVLNMTYIALNDNAVGPTPERRQIYSSSSIALSKQWTIMADARRDLSDTGGMISSGANVAYQGDCVNFVTAVTKEFTRDQDIRPATSITFQIFLKNLN